MRLRTEQPTPFRLESTPTQPLKRALFRVARPGLERMLAFPALNHLYRAVESDGQLPPQQFIRRLLDRMGVRVRVLEKDLEKIPASGPLIVVANHPFGGIEGLILADVLLRVRPDVKLMANYILSMVPDIRDLFFFVDPFERPDSISRNIASTKAAIRWVKGGGVLGIFPAGEVSHLTWSKRVVSDPDWTDTVARIVKHTDASVLPIFFDGRNSDLFQAAGLVHPRLRTVLLPREFLAQQGRKVRLHVGSVLPAARLRRFEQPQELTAYLRMRTYILRSHANHDLRRNGLRRQVGPPRKEEAIVPPVAPELLRQDVDALPADRVLVASGEMTVYYAYAQELPHVLREIGRLRELTFRPIGEGTGRSIDLDRFDQYYLHLFIWHTKRHDVVGAYRMGRADDILRQYGKDGLYTCTLFKYKKRLLEQLGPTLELGRSFVRQEYQKEYAPLLLLWKGIGRYVVRHPQYRYLFGPVSISNKYRSVSKHLLMAFLRVHRHMKALSKLIRPKNPPRLSGDRRWDSRLRGKVVPNIDEQSINELVSEIEADGKPMPVLLRQYLKLNGKLLGFNVDPDFGDVLDGLLLIDLTQVDRGVLNRYLGKEGAPEFLARYGVV